MKWMLIVMVFGTAPVKTELVFDTLDDCLRADDQMRAAYAQAFNDWNKGNQSTKEDRSFMIRRNGLQNEGTCIPHAAMSSK